MRRRALTVVVTCSALVAGGLAYAAPASAGPAGEYVYVAATPGGSILRLHDGATGEDNVLTGSEITSVSPDHVGLQVSRDGRRVAVTTFDDLDYSSRLHVYDRDTEVLDFLVSSGPDAGFSGLDWMPDSRHLLVAAQLPDGGTQDLWLVGLDRSRVTLPGTRGVSGFDVSPGGDLLAYSVPTTAGVPRVWLATIDGTARVDLGVAGESPQWSHDGSQLLATLPLYSPDKERVGSIAETFSPRGTGRTLYEATFLSGQVGFGWSRSHVGSVVGYHEGTLSEIPLTAGATWTTVPTVSPSAVPAAPWSAPDATAPTLTYPPLLAIEDTGVRFAWSNAAVRDPDIVAVRVALSPGMTPPAAYAAGARRTTVLGRVYTTRFTGLVAGAVYSYAMWSMDASGNLSDPRTGHVRLVPAVVSLTAPAVASSTSTGGWIRIGYATSSASASGVILEAASGGRVTSAFDIGLQLGRSGVYYYGRGGFPETLQPGQNYRIRIGTRDEWGNPHWSSTTLVSQYPTDDRDGRLSYAGSWSRVTTTGAWLGTTSATRAGGSAAYLYPYRQDRSVKRFAVIATTSPTGGRFRVYVDGRYVTTVSTRSSSTLLRRQVWTSAALAPRRTHSVRIVQVSGSGWVRLDAVSVLLQ